MGIGVGVYEFIHFGQKCLLLVSALFPLGLQVGFCPFFDFVIDAPDCRSQASLFGEQLHDVQPV